MKVTVVYDNCVTKQGLEAGWGFSALVEIENRPPLLFDTGADGTTLLHNMEKLDIDPMRIGVIVISHAHGDHTGGLWDILELNREVEVYVPASSGARIAGRKVIAVTKSFQVSEKVFSTGELEGVEQSLALKTEKGIVVVIGCSHPGVGRIISAASEFGKVYGIVGGFHGFRDFELLNDLFLICPCHCTQYKSEIRRLFPKQCIACGAGLELEL